MGVIILPGIDYFSTINCYSSMRLSIGNSPSPDVDKGCPSRGVYALCRLIMHRDMVWRCGGLLVSVLDFRSGGRWFEHGLCRRVVSLDKKLCSTFSLFIGDHNAGGNLRWASISPRGE